MRIIISLVLASMLGFSIYQGADIYKLTNKINDQKYDYAEINKINYGLFNFELWKDKLFDIVKKKANNFEFNGDDFGDIQKEIEKYLYGLNRDYIESGKLVEMLMDKESKDNKMVGFLMNMFKGNIESTIKDLNFKAKVPMIAAEMMGELDKKAPEIKKAIIDKVSDILLKDTSVKLRDSRDVIYEKYAVAGFAECNTEITNNIDGMDLELKAKTKYALGALIAAMLILFIGRMGLSFKETIIWMALGCTVFLMLGISNPL